MLDKLMQLVDVKVLREAVNDTLSDYLGEHATVENPNPDLPSKLEVARELLEELGKHVKEATDEELIDALMKAEEDQHL